MQNSQQSEEGQELAQNDDLQNDDVLKTETLQNDDPKAQEPGDNKQEQNQGYDSHNAELEQFLNESATTKAEQQSQAQEQEQSSSLPTGFMDKDEAAQLAVMGVVHSVKLASEHTGRQLKLNQLQLTVISTMFVPVIIKHGNAVKRYLATMTDGIDEESYIPEYVAGAGVVGLGGSLWWSNKQARKAARAMAANDEPAQEETQEETQEPGTNGD